MVAEVGNTRMCVQEASWGVLSWDDCRFRAVLRPNTEPMVTASGGTQMAQGVTARPPKHLLCVQGHLCQPHLLCKLTDTAQGPN